MDRIAVEKKKADALIADAKKIAANPEQAAQAWKDRVLKDDLRERLQREKTDREVNIEREELAERAVEVQRRCYENPALVRNRDQPLICKNIGFALSVIGSN